MYRQPALWTALAMFATLSVVSSDAKAQSNSRLSQYQAHVQALQKVGRPQYRSRYYQPAGLSSRDFRRIDALTVQLMDSAHELEVEVNQHFGGERHAAKLASDCSELNRVAQDLHDELHLTANGHSDEQMVREKANEFIEIVARLPRTIGLIENQPLSRNGRRGTAHMMQAYREAHRIAMRIDGYLPADDDILVRQADRVAIAVQQLHDEFHGHLDGYDYSHRIDRDLQQLEGQAQHIFDMAYNQTGRRWQLRHVARDARELRDATRRVESLLKLQASRGVRSSDWIGLEHSMDAITDIHASTYLLEHMIKKSTGYSTYQPSPTYKSTPTYKSNRIVRSNIYSGTISTTTPKSVTYHNNPNVVYSNPPTFRPRTYKSNYPSTPVVIIHKTPNASSYRPVHVHNHNGGHGHSGHGKYTKPVKVHMGIVP